MQKYSGWRALYMSFYSASFYNDVVRRWPGVGLLYLFLWCFFIAAIGTAMVAFSVSEFDASEVADKIVAESIDNSQMSFDEQINRALDVVSQIPDMQIIDKKMVIDAKQPYFVVDPVTNNILAIFDTTGEFQVLQEGEALLLVTEKHVFIAQGDGGSKVHEIDESSPEFNVERNHYFRAIGQIPLIRLNNGVASMDGDSPVILEGLFAGEHVRYAVFDMSGEYNNLQESESFMLLTARELFFYNPFTKDIVRSRLSEIDADVLFMVLEYVFVELKALAMIYVPLFFIFFLVLLLFIWLLFLVLVGGFFAMIIGKLFGLSKMSYEDGMRVSAICLTPVILFNFVFTGVFNNQGLISLLIMAGYVVFALWSAREVENV